MKTTSILCPTCKKIIFLGPTEDEGKCLSCGQLAKAPGVLLRRQVTPDLILPDDSADHFPAVSRPLVVQVQHATSREASWSHSLGIGATVLGVIALPISLIPFVGMLSILLGGVGLGLAWFGLMAAFSRRGHGIGYPLAALTLNGLALLIGLFWAGTLKTVRDWIDQAQDRTLAKVAALDREEKEEAGERRRGLVVAGAKQVIEPRDGPAPAREIKTVRIDNVAPLNNPFDEPEPVPAAARPTISSPAKKPVELTDADRERIARSRLQQAIKLEEVGNLKAASQRLAKLIDEFPATAAAGEARKKLETIDAVLKVREIK